MKKRGTFLHHHDWKISTFRAEVMEYFQKLFSPGIIILLFAAGSGHAAFAVGDCGKCDTDLRSCYAACDQIGNPLGCRSDCESNPGLGETPGFVQCVDSNCYGDVNTYERTECQVRANTLERYCLNGDVRGYPVSYNLCIALGNSVDYCCALIGEMRYDDCCKTSYCP